MAAIRTDNERLAREAGFFDQFYRDESTHFDPSVLARYSSLSSRGLYSKEFRIGLLGDLREKRVLDVGCGTGGNSVLLALLGANVVGLDVSPVAIAKAQELAINAGVENRTQFQIEPFESFRPPHRFDVVWVDCFLHHMLPVFDETLRVLSSLVKPGGVMIISEPVRTSALVRSLRSFFPPNSEATPDERPLERAELASIERHLAIRNTRYFHGLARATVRVLGSNSYEHAPPSRRMLADVLGRLDSVLLRIPVVRDVLGGIVVIVGTPRQI